MVTDDELRQIMPNLKADRRALMLPFIQAAMQEFEITSYLREAAFLAQLAHESAELRFMEEIASGAAYEGRRDLGNTQPGDGKRYKGRGPIQLTGRANYQKYGALLGLDLVGNPTQAATPEVGFRIAGLFWKSNGLNQLADEQNFKAITKRINGGFNGLADRQMYYDRAKRVLSRDDAVPSTPEDAFAGVSTGAGGATRGLPTPGGGTPPATTREVPPNLSRGIYPAQEGGGAKKASAKKAAGKKASGKKASSTKGGAKKAASRKASSGKATGKKSSGKKASTKKVGAKKTSAKKGASKKGGAKKGGAKKGGGKRGVTQKGAAASRGGSKKGSKKSASKKGGARGRG